MSLYVEEQAGDGRPLLLVPGAGGDAGSFEALSAELAPRHRVVAYDRRGCSRSTRPPAWTSTSLAEQADDAAGVIAALELGPTAVVGTSSGGAIALEVARRHPGLVSALVLHEPALVYALPDGKALHEQLRARLEGDRLDGDRVAFERFLRFAHGDAAWECLAESTRERHLANARVFLDLEFEPFTRGRPPERSEPVSRPAVMRGADSPPFLEPLCDVVADRLGVPVIPVPGGHLGYVTHPSDFARALNEALASGASE